MSKDLQTPKAVATRARLLTFAIAAFTQRDMASVSIAEIAREADLTPQAVYRYFKGKDELYRAALAHDVDTLQNSVLAELVDAPLPALTGALWSTYSHKVDAHPFAKAVIATRAHDMLTFVSELPSTRAIFDRIEREFVEAQRHGVIRSDIDVESTMGSSTYLFSFVLLPLLFDGRFNGPEWLRVSYMFSASIFSPMPNLSDPIELEKFRATMESLADSITSARAS